jgi:hypothetical protein
MLWWAAMAGVLAVLAALVVVAPAVPAPPMLAYVIGFACVGGSAIASGLTCPRVQRRALWLLTLPIAALVILDEQGSDSLAEVFCVAMALLYGGSLLGAIVGGEVEHAGYLIFVAIVSSAMDLVSVFHPTGPSAMIAASPRALSLVAMPWPMLGTSQIEPFLGVGDIVFTSLYIAACRRHGLRTSRTVAALALGYAATAATVIALARPVPALPLLGAAVVGMHAEARRPPEVERMRGTVVTVLVVVACAAILVIRFR